MRTARQGSGAVRPGSPEPPRAVLDKKFWGDQLVHREWFAMPPISAPAAIRAILHTDPTWSVYALGDLAPHLFARAAWFRSADTPPTLVLLYRGFDPPVLFALGEA